MIINYRIVSAQSPGLLETAVQELMIKQGWEPIGGPIYAKRYSVNEWHQAMVQRRVV